MMCLAGSAEGALHRLQLALPQYPGADLEDMQVQSHCRLGHVRGAKRARGWEGRRRVQSEKGQCRFAVLLHRITKQVSCSCHPLRN